MSYKILLTTLICLLVVGGKAWAEDIGDVDADVEETISDSDAAKAQAVEQKARAAKEKEDTEVARKAEEKARAAAEAKKQVAREELKRLDVEIRAYKAEQAKLQTKLEKHNRDISYSETSIQNATAKNEKSKAATAALQGLTAEKIAKIAELENKRKEVAQETIALNQKLTDAKADFAKTQAAEKVSAQKLEQTKHEQALKKAQTDAQIAQLKEKHKASVAKTDALEKQIRDLREKSAKLDEEVKSAESEVKQSDAQLQDAKERLADVSARSQAKEAELLKRKSDANSKLHSHVREAEEASLKIDQDKADQSLNRSTAATDKGSVNVQMRGKATLAKMTLSRDCRVFERPNGRSKVLGTKRAGSHVTGGQAQSEWVGFPLKAGRTGWVAKACF